MTRQGATFTAAVAAMITMVATEPAAADVLGGVKRDLKKIEDQLRAGNFDSARKTCDRSMKDLIDNDVHGKGSLPVYGLVLAFRAVAEAGLGDLAEAVWDWTAAGQFSPAATGFDLERFGQAGEVLQGAIANAPEALGFPGPIRPRGEVPQPVIPRTPNFRLEAFECRVRVTQIIDANGTPIRVDGLGGACLDMHPALAVLALEAQRGWRFEPVQHDGRNVTIRHEITTTFRQNLDGFQWR